MDIGGGSTEFIIGSRLKPVKMESLYMGCVSYSLRFFPEGKITKGAMKRAELAAGSEMQAIAAEFSSDHWEDAFGSSGTARALGEIIKLNNFDGARHDGDITREGLENFREHMLQGRRNKKTGISGLRPDRAPVIPGASPSCPLHFPNWASAACPKPWERCGKACSMICWGASIIRICEK